MVLETFESCDVVTRVKYLCCGLQDGSRRSPFSQSVDAGFTDDFSWGVTPVDSRIGYTFIIDTSRLIEGEFGGYTS